MLVENYDNVRFQSCIFTRNIRAINMWSQLQI
jgi:hypothetical protein